MFVNNFFQTGAENQLPSLAIEIYILPERVCQAAELYALGMISLSQLAEAVEAETLILNDEQELMATAMEYAAVYSAKYDAEYGCI